MAKFKVKCVKAKQGGYDIYSFIAKASDVYKFVSINKRDEDSGEGYQRALSGTRVKAVSKYIQDGNLIPTSILISLDKASFDANNSELIIPINKSSGWVIDGQHRLAGAHHAKSDIKLSFVAFVGMSIQDQIKQFVVINREAKGVPTSLYYDLLKEIPDAKTETEISKERAADIAAALKKDEESFFTGRIVTVTSPKKGQMSLNNFVRKVAPIVKAKTGRFGVYNLYEQVGIIKNYFTALATIYPKLSSGTDPLFAKTIGFGALMNVLPTVFDLSQKTYSAFRVQDIVAIFSAVDHFDFEAWNKAGSGNAAETQASEDLRLELIEAFTSEDGGATAVVLS